ncbi:hypothetical protein FFZ99_10200 [Leptospira interrogans]|uniref:hypothetical protein n=1 Tax=Leptospira interrogans TaxID=173 RepID=UPI0002BC63BE|nr:hypothetical protein [Leptospira interrogans]KYZ60731.1 hypothetical protein AWU66_01655 [Leptospira interrogans serovar Pomona]OMH73025.1 hypothetical protein BW243_01980 [Leptospira interrogans serovar Pomona]TQE57669.1 hypothetical protein FF006_10015 [Leptospira interrogans]TQE62680.1 hypothetical protein FFZ99_10200 [Leptospira interrogans]TQE66865.1 hypothetical protein FF001_09130 [Leptospira interrogans]
MGLIFLNLSSAVFQIMMKNNIQLATQNVRVPTNPDFIDKFKKCRNYYVQKIYSKIDSANTIGLYDET